MSTWIQQVKIRLINVYPALNGERKRQAETLESFSQSTHHGEIRVLFDADRDSMPGDT